MKQENRRLVQRIRLLRSSPWFLELISWVVKVTARQDIGCFNWRSGSWSSFIYLFFHSLIITSYSNGIYERAVRLGHKILRTFLLSFGQELQHRGNRLHACGLLMRRQRMPLMITRWFQRWMTRMKASLNRPCVLTVNRSHLWTHRLFHSHRLPLCSVVIIIL